MRTRLLTLALSVLSLASASAKPITREQALQRACTFMAEQRDFRRLLPVVDDRRLAPRRRGAQTAGEVLPYYVFDKGNGEGYVIVSGDDQTIGVLGYCDDGTFDYEQLPPNMREWLDDYARQIALLQSGDAVARRAPSTHPKVEQLMTSKWSQGNPYNLNCPLDGGSRSVTGCVATAMAQLLYYNRERSVSETTAAIPAYETWTKKIRVAAIPAGSPIDWSHMADTYGAATDLQKKAVADLMLYCGAAAKMDYTASSSGAQSWDAYQAFAKYFGYGKSVKYYSYQDIATDEQWDAIVYAEMAAGRPIYISGSNSEGGHAFVCDGYDGNLRYHINWGWGGQSDGYYYLTNLTPGQGQGIGGSSSGYNSYREIIVGLEPENYGAKAMSFADATAKRICLAHFDADADGTVSYSEAAAVTTLGDAFQGQTTLKTFAELYYFTSLTALPDDAFAGCRQLESVKLPKALTVIGQRAFKGCDKLRQLILPSGITAIGQEAFDGCKQLTQMELPTALTAIAPATFRDCQSLTAIGLPLAVDAIGSEAFARCTRLASMSVKTFRPATISMGDNVFDGTDLSKATLHVMQGTKAFFADAPQWQHFGTIVEQRELSAGQFATVEAGQTYYLYNVATGMYLTKGEAWGTQAIVSESPMRFKLGHTASMPEGVYYLTSPDTGKSGTYLFRTTSDDNVGQGVAAAFVDGTSLTPATCYWHITPTADDDRVYTIQTPATAATYQEGLYWGVQTDHASNAAAPTYGVYADVSYATHAKGCQWQFVRYDEAITQRYEAAQVLANLLAIAKRQGAKAGAEQAVYDNLDSSTEQILAAQASLRKKLSLVSFADATLRDNCIRLFDANFDGELSYAEAADVTDLGYSFTFTRNTGITTFDELQYFTSVPSIYGNTFEGCTNLVSIVLPKGVEHIYYRAFMGCKKLTAINLPEYLSTLGDNCFNGCTALREVRVSNPDPASISLGSGVFSGVDLQQCTLYVPFGTKALYAAASVWKDFGAIVEMRAATRPAFSTIAAGAKGYLCHVATRKMVAMGEAYGTQSVVARTGRLYLVKRTSTMADGLVYLEDAATGKVLFRTDTDEKVGAGVRACFGDGTLSAKAYWSVQPVEGQDHVFTLSLPETDAAYVPGQYLGIHDMSETAGIYWDVEGQNSQTAWTFISEDDMRQAAQTDDVAGRLRQMLLLARERGIDAADEQAVYDNALSTADDLRVALLGVRNKLQLVTFDDAGAQTLCLDAWDADGDGELSFAEAAAVTDLGEVFRAATDVKSFAELRHFTSLTHIPDNAFRGASNLQMLYLPPSVRSIGTYAFVGCNVLRSIVLLNDGQVVDFGRCNLAVQSTVYVPEQLIAAYQADDSWSQRTVTPYTGQPVVTATASRIYGRSVASIAVQVLGAPVTGTPVCTCDAIADVALPVGTYPITVQQGTVTTLGAQMKEGVLTIEPATLTATAKSYTRRVGEDNPTFEVTIKGFRNHETEAQLTALPTATCSATKDSPAGTYDIVVDGGEAQNYVFSYTAGTLTIVGSDGIGHATLSAGSSHTLHDLQGRRIKGQPARQGIYIVDGKKTSIR